MPLMQGLEGTFGQEHHLMKAKCKLLVTGLVLRRHGLQKPFLPVSCGSDKILQVKGLCRGSTKVGALDTASESLIACLSTEPRCNQLQLHTVIHKQGLPSSCFSTSPAVIYHSCRIDAVEIPLKRLLDA